MSDDDTSSSAPDVDRAFFPIGPMLTSPCPPPSLPDFWMDVCMSNLRRCAERHVPCKEPFVLPYGFHVTWSRHGSVDDGPSKLFVWRGNAHKTCTYIDSDDAVEFILNAMVSTARCNGCDEPRWLEPLASNFCDECLRRMSLPCKNIRDDCAICKEPMWTKRFVDLHTCTHTFHYTCLNTYALSKAGCSCPHDDEDLPCPLCRTMFERSAIE